MPRCLIALLVTLALSLFVAPLVADAQPAAKVPRIGFLMPSLTPERARNLEAFRQGLRELGWIEGQNVAIEYRYAEAGTDTERFPDLAADLVRLNVDVLVTVGGTTRVAQDATRTIPIVMVTAADPVVAGFVTSLARPEEGSGQNRVHVELGMSTKMPATHTSVKVASWPSSSHTTSWTLIFMGAILQSG